jgi:uncharacterized membrane protein (UPF0127 family)
VDRPPPTLPPAARSRWPAGLLAAAAVVALVALPVGALALLRAGRHEPAAAGKAAPATAYRLEPAGRPPVRVSVEVAADPAARAAGLMGRDRLAPGTGMVFLFPGDVRVAFWMKDTLVALSIAFVAADGRVVGVREMAPCRADPCPTYAAPGPYRYALEMAAGAFRDAGVGPGDRIVPEDPGRLPAAR